MEPTRIAVGDAFRWSHDDRPIRVLLHDGDVVMYDGWWPHLNNWGLADLRAVRRRTINYYVTLSATVSEKATFVRLAPLTDEEFALHRPDLPFTVVQRANLAWGGDLVDGSADGVSGEGVHTAELYVVPFGPEGGSKTPVRVVADDGIAFTAAEILLKAQSVQRPMLSETSVVAGVGLYRQGLVRGVPGAESRLQTHIAEVEVRKR